MSEPDEFDLNVVAMSFPESDDSYLDQEDDQFADDEWAPVVGPNFGAVLKATSANFHFISREPSDSSANWESEVKKIAGRCLPPSQKSNKRAQLVFGRVQAGKTSNFTGLISLLSDNDYELFIVLAGINLNLRTQTFDRLVKDLGVATDPRFEVVASNTQVPISTEVHRISQALRRQGGTNTFASQFRRKLVYVVLKEDDNLKWINGILSEIRNDYSHAELLDKTSVLVIDDEVDQASPDPHTNDSSRVGAIHEQISQLRDALRTHSYVGYTATPYANLLMVEGNRLRCEVVSVLDAGKDYVGPETLFTDLAPEFGRVIDDWNSARTTIPRSLVSAFATFIAQATIINGPYEIRERFLASPFLDNTDSLTPVSMLVQPHQQTSYATKVFEELVGLRSNWLRAIETPLSIHGVRDVSWVNLWEVELKPAFAEFGIIGGDLTEDLVARAEAIIAEAEIREINGPGREKGFEFPTSREFSAKPAWVLIGGQLLDRGQTLPNLVNTYMPRPPGGSGNTSIRGNIDTLQQRGRFYGQRGQYLALLRGAFDADTLDTYREIARIEPKNIRAIQRLSDAGLGIQKLPLVLELGTGNLRAASPNKIPRETVSISNSTWLFRQMRYKLSTNADLNKDLLAEYFSKLDVSSRTSRPLTHKANFANHFFESRIADVINLFEKWDCSPKEKLLFKVAADLLKDHAALGHQSVDLQLMSRPIDDPFSTASFGEFRTGTTVARPTDRSGSAQEMRITGLTSSNDAKFLPEERAAIQIHYFDIRLNENPGDPQNFVDQVGLAFSFKNSRRLNVYEGESN